jgi:hypothetical protein
LGSGQKTLHAGGGARRSQYGSHSERGIGICLIKMPILMEYKPDNKDIVDLLDA